jgi:CMP-N-acetylneuraminic acid synthetase
MRKTGCDSVRTAAEEKSYHPLKTLVLSDEKSGRVIPVISLIPSLSSLGADVPRQLLPKMLRPVGIVYATKPKWIDIGRVWGDDVRYLPVSYEKITDIDVPEDLEKAEKIMRALKLLE